MRGGSSTEGAACCTWISSRGVLLAPTVTTLLAQVREMERRAEEQRKMKEAADEEWRRQQREREVLRKKVGGLRGGWGGGKKRMRHAVRVLKVSFECWLQQGAAQGPSPPATDLIFPPTLRRRRRSWSVRPRRWRRSGTSRRWRWRALRRRQRSSAARRLIKSEEREAKGVGEVPALWRVPAALDLGHVWARRRCLTLTSAAWVAALAGSRSACSARSRRARRRSAS